MQSADLDFSAIDRLQYVDRDSIQLKNMHHSDFTSFAMTGEAMHVPIKPVYNGTGWDRSTARRGYELASNIVLSFLDLHVKQDAQAGRRLAALTKETQVASTGRRAALPFPPSPADVTSWAKAGKAVDLKPRFQAACGKRPLSECVDQDAFNNSGYGLLKARQADAALVLFELVAWAHPRSANAQDSLADGYLAAGKKQQAVEASKRVLALVGTDPSIDDATRTQLVEAARQRLSSLGGE
jgi:tetratricopeptide (TPR) repeat protein